MTETEEPTFSLIVLSFTKGAEDEGLIRALCDAFRFGADEARAIVEGVPLRVKRGADRAMTRQLASQLLGLGAELCIQNEQTGVEKLYYPGSGYTDDDAPPSRDPIPSSGARKRFETAPGARRAADPGASMRDALRQARQRSQSGDAAPISIRHAAEGATVSVPPAAPPISVAPPLPITLPPAAEPEPPPPPLLIELSPPAAPKPFPLPRKRTDRDAEEAAEAARRLRRRVALALGALILLGGAGLAASLLAPKPMLLDMTGQIMKASMPKGATEGEASAISLLTELGAARLTIRTAVGGGASIRSCVLAHLAFTTPPKLEGPAVDRVMQYVVDELAPGAKVGEGEAATHGAFKGRQAHFAGAGGGGPFGKMQVFPLPQGGYALLVILGSSSQAADGPEATAWLDSFSERE